MIKDIDKMPQKKLKKLHISMLAVHTLIAFIAPIITILCMTFTSGQVQEKWKLPILTVIIVVAIVAGAAKVFKKKVERIKILNIDGTYNQKMRSFKHTLLFISHAFLPIVGIIVTAIFATFLKDCIDFYSRMILIVLGFSVGGILIDKIILAEIEEELDIRDQLAQANAVERRKNSLMNTAGTKNNTSKQ